MAVAPQRSPSQKWRQLPGRGCARVVVQSGTLRMRGYGQAGNHGQEGRGAERGPGGEGVEAGGEEEGGRWCGARGGHGMAWHGVAWHKRGEAAATAGAAFPCKAVGVGESPGL